LSGTDGDYNHVIVTGKSIRLYLGIGLLVIGLPFLVWGNIPHKSSDLFRINFSPEELSLPSRTDEEALSLLPGEGRKVEFTGAKTIRLGDQSRYRLVWLPVNFDGYTQGSDVYELYNLVARARLEIDDLDPQPAGDLITPLRPGIPVDFSWIIRADSPGVKNGEVWIHVDFIPRPDLNSPEPASTRLLAVPGVNIKVSSLMGFAGLPARVIGGVLLVVGIVLVFEPLISAIITNLFSKKNSQKPKNRT